MTDDVTFPDYATWSNNIYNFHINEHNKVWSKQAFLYNLRVELEDAFERGRALGRREKMSGASIVNGVYIKEDDYND